MWRHLRTYRVWRPSTFTFHRSLRFISTETQLNAYRDLYFKLSAGKVDPELGLSHRLIHGESIKERLEAISRSDVPATDNELRTAMAFLVSPGPSIEDLLQSVRGGTPLPSWLVLYVLHRCVESSVQVGRAWELVRACLPRSSPEMKCLLIVSSAHVFVDSEIDGLLLELTDVVEEISSALPPAFWDPLLRALLRRPSPICISKVLHSMFMQMVVPSSDVIDLLLSSTHFTLEIALALDRCFAKCGLIPTIEHTKAFLHTAGIFGDCKLLQAPSSSFIGQMSYSLDLSVFHNVEPLVAATTSLQLAIHLRNAQLLEWRWLYVASAPSMQAAFDQLQRLKNVGTDGKESGMETPPEWLLLYLLRSKVHNEEDACVAFHLIDLYHHTATDSLRPCLLTTTAYWCAKFDAVVFLRRIAQQFLFLPAKPNRLHFDYFLQALAYAPPSKETSVLIRTILSAMKAKSASTSSSAVDHLFNDKMTLDVANDVEYGFKPEKGFTRQQLETLVVLSARNRQRKKAAWYLRLLRRSLARDGSRKAPLGPDPMVTQSHGLGPQDRMYMQSFKRYRILRRYVVLMARTHSAHPSRIMSNTKTPDENLPSAVSGGSSDVSAQPTIEDKGEGERESGEITPSVEEDVPSAPYAAPRMSVKDWSATLYVASRDNSVIASAFIELYRKGVEELSITPTSVTYHIAIRGLLKKGALEEALVLWREFCSSGLRLDTIILGLGVSVLTENGLASEAFALLEYVHSHQHKPISGHRGSSRHVSYVNTVAVNSFLISLSRVGRPDVVYELWNHMEGLYQTRPDVYTLNIMLRTARWALKYNDSIRGTLTEMGILSHPSEMYMPERPDRGKAVECIHGMLDPDIDHRVLGFWESHSAGKVALRIAFELFMNNWPELRNVESPVRALRSSSSSQLTAPISDAYHSFRGGPKTLPTLETTLPILSRSKSSRMLYSRIVPTNVTFRLLLDLLGAESLSAEIPLVLAWMRTLNIVPSRSTLATAIVYWTEVGSDAPLIEALKGGQYHSPYKRLVDWMTEWVGVGNMPQGVHIQAERKRVRYYKETSYRDMLDRARGLSDDVD